MLRASISSDRRCRSAVTARCRRWIDGGGGGCGDRRPSCNNKRRPLPITSSSSSPSSSAATSSRCFHSTRAPSISQFSVTPQAASAEHYHYLDPRRVRHQHHCRGGADNGARPHHHPRERNAARKMSTKPSYDFSEDDDDDGAQDNMEQHQLRWLERSSGLEGFERFSSYDNFHRYGSPPPPPPPPPRRNHNGMSGAAAPSSTRGNRAEGSPSVLEEGSLLNLLNGSGNYPVNGDRARPSPPRVNAFSEEETSLLSLLNRDENIMESPSLSNGAPRPNRTESGYGEETSLLDLLNGHGENENARYAPRSDLDHRASETNGESYEGEGSLLRLLGEMESHDRQQRPPSYRSAGARPRMDDEMDEEADNRGGEASLLSLLSDIDAEGGYAGASHSSLNGLQDEDDARLQYQRSEEGPSLLDMLNGYEHDAPPTGLNGLGMQFQDERLEPTIMDEPDQSLHDLLSDETKDTEKDAKYRDLARLQLQLEIESTEEAMRKAIDVWYSARKRSDFETLPVVRRALDSWYGPLTEAIEVEQWLYLNADNKTCSAQSLWRDGSSSDSDSDQEEDEKLARTVKDRTSYGPLLCLLPPRKIAVILAHAALQMSLIDKSGESRVVSLALYIAQAIETEVNVSRALRVRAREQRRMRPSVGEGFGGEEDADDPGFGSAVAGGVVPTIRPSGIGQDVSIDNWVYTATHLQRFLDEVSTSGGSAGTGKSLQGLGNVRPERVRKRCKEILLAEGFVAEGMTEEEANKPLSMTDFVDWDPVKKVKLGAALIRLLLDHATFTPPTAGGRGRAEPEPAFQHGRKGSVTGKAHGCISIHPDLWRIAVQDEFAETTSFLSPSMSNTRVQPMVIPPNNWTSVDSGGYETIKVPFMRTRHCKTQRDSIHRADLSQVMEGLNVLGNIPWKINQKVLDAAVKCWDDGIILGDIPSRVDYEVPPMPEPLPYTDYQTLGDFEKKGHLEAYRKYREAVTKHKRFKQKNMDLHSLRCSAILKLNQAKKFRDFEEIFFPYNVDFRGRAYPVPPHLSIVGSDLCRALLMFAHPKPLGKNGLYWLKVHLANLAGADKMSFDGRAKFAEDHMDSIRAAVDDPFGEDDWWTKFDDPFQGLATCNEIVKAIDSGDPENYMCSLPVHMDGSCNGLQHYAALGRDKEGGKAVNLCVADKPQDVYIGVMHEVIRRVAQDADEMVPFDEDKSDLTGAEKDLLKKVKSARLVNGLIDRGVVKRTVMTSVYGVTYIGAKNQISEKIEEKLEAKGVDIDEKENEIHTACGYLASLTMEVMGQQFKGARQTMNWLTECARLIAAQGQPVAFVSPIGVPVCQPYRQRKSFSVVTLLQNITLTNDSDVLPLHRQRQVSAFPPNYVHSLDSSHMLLTAIEMQKRGKYFSAVHDSYWTHACDIEEMNGVLRDTFIDLYNQPLLEQLKQSWEFRYPSIAFPDLPACGDLNLEDVRSAPYFFQ